MELTDLMIGDVVMLDDKVMKVVEIYDDRFSGLSVRLRGEYGLYSAREVKPVPLTEDLLEANGWDYDKEQSLWFNGREHNTRGLPLFIYASDNAGQLFFCDYITIDSVHELQHCLRQTGQNDLADNFKVE